MTVQIAPASVNDGTTFSSPILDAALWYAEHGWPVFPCRPTKAPYTQSGFKDASADADQIRAWLARWPDAMLGLPTGAVSGVVVIDLDVDATKGFDGIAEMRRLEREHGALPPGPCATTPRGGRHMFFRYDKDRLLGTSSGGLPRGIDVRGDGGYVIVAPSSRDDGCSYEWSVPPFDDLDFPDMPDWLHDIITGQRQQPVASTLPTPSRQPAAPAAADTRRRRYALAALAHEAGKVTNATEGKRNTLLNEAAHAIGNFVGSGHLTEAEVIAELTSAAKTAGLGGAEAAKTVRSGLNAGKKKAPRWPEDMDDTEQGGAPHGEGTSRASWDRPDLSVLDEGRRAPPAFKPEWLGPQLARYVEDQAYASSAPVDYVAVALLGLAGGILSNRRRPIASSGWQEPPLLWCATIGTSSAGKGRGTRSVIGLIRDKEAELLAHYDEQMRQYEKDLAEAEDARKASRRRRPARASADPAILSRDITEPATTCTSPEPAAGGGIVLPDCPEGVSYVPDPVRPRLRRIHFGDTTIEGITHASAENPTGLTLYREELFGWFAGLSRNGSASNDRQVYLEAYDGGRFVIDRVKLAGKPMIIDHFSIGIVGGVTPDRVVEMIAGGADGLTSRFLWSWPDRLPKIMLARAPADHSLAQAAILKLHDLRMQSNPVPKPDSPITVSLTDAALDRMQEFTQEMYAREPAATTLMQSTLGRARGHAMRLACVLQYLWWASFPTSQPEPDKIGEVAVATAIEMMKDYFLPMAERVFGDAAIPAAETGARVVARHIVEKKLTTFRSRDVRHTVGGPVRDAASMDAVCDELVEAGWIKAIEKEKKGRGRPAKEYHVNPAVFAALGINGDGSE